MGNGIALFVDKDSKIRPDIKNSDRILRRFNERLLEVLPPAVRTLRGRLENVIRDRGVRTGNAIENPIEGNFRPFRIAALAGFDQRLRLTMCRS